MSYHTDYLMPFGWGESNAPQAGRRQHPVNMLKVGESYKPTDKTDKDRAQSTTSRLRKRVSMDIKYANGMFTRVK